MAMHTHTHADNYVHYTVHSYGLGKRIGHGTSLKEFLDHSHVAENVVSLPSLIPISRQEIEQESREAHTHVDEVVPEGAGVARDAFERVLVDAARGEGVLQ